MFTTVEKLITTRNLKPKKKEGFLKVISIFSFLGIMLGVATLIIVMSVMNGFRTELTEKILGFNSHVTVKPYSTSITEKLYSQLLSHPLHTLLNKKQLRYIVSDINSYNLENHSCN